MENVRGYICWWCWCLWVLEGLCWFDWFGMMDFVREKVDCCFFWWRGGRVNVKNWLWCFYFVDLIKEGWDGYFFWCFWVGWVERSVLIMESLIEMWLEMCCMFIKVFRWGVLILIWLCIWCFWYSFVINVKDKLVLI